MYYKFPAVLKKIRLSFWCNQRGFAERLNVPYGTYPAWEAGYTMPQYNRMVDISNILIKSGVQEDLVAELKNAFIAEKSK